MVNIIFVGIVLVVVLAASVYVITSYTTAMKPKLNQNQVQQEKKINEAIVQKDAIGRVPQKIGSVDVIAGGVSETEITVNK